MDKFQLKLLEKQLTEHIDSINIKTVGEIIRKEPTDYQRRVLAATMIEMLDSNTQSSANYHYIKDWLLERLM